MPKKFKSTSSTASKTRNFLKSNLVLVRVAVVVVVISFISFYAAAVHNRDRQLDHNKCMVDACIALSYNSTQPQVLTIKSGSYIQFNSSDGNKHNVELIHSGIQHEDARRYQSGDFGAGEAWKVQFKRDGSYIFEDKYNQKAEVSVIVYTEGKDYKVR